MAKSIKKIIILILIAGLFMSGSGFVFGQGSVVDPDAINQEIKQLNNNIQNQKNKIKKLKAQQKIYSEAIKKKQAEKATLNNQLAILDNRLAKAELDIEMVKTDIERIKLEINKTDIAIQDKNKEIEHEKEHLANILRLIYKRDNVTTLEILLLNKTLGDFLSQVKYLADLNEGVGESLDDLEKLKRQLEREKENLARQNEELLAHQKDLEAKKKKYESEKEAKIYLLEQTRQSERQYQRLLLAAKKEQEEASAEIASLEKQVRAKLAALEGKKLEFNDNGFIWPVSSHIITAYFHDPDYPFRYLFEHPAIDIATPQGTPIKAAASGYVARTKTPRIGKYSYIMLIHGNGLATVYGHVSKVLVKEDEYVVQGQTIGLSGGMPGTPGAGRLTTGPHLHFEIRLNGIPVDPLSYLP